jgi:hypothetical protein
VSDDGVVEVTPDGERWLWLFRGGNLSDAFRQQRVLSPEGRWLAYEKDQTIWLVDLEARRHHRLAGGEGSPCSAQVS